MKQLNLLSLKLNCVFLIKICVSASIVRLCLVIWLQQFRLKKNADFKFLWLNKVVFVRIQYKVLGLAFQPIHGSVLVYRFTRVIQKTQQCSKAKQRFVKKGVQWLMPLYRYTRTQTDPLIKRTIAYTIWLNSRANAISKNKFVKKTDTRRWVVWKC